MKKIPTLFERVFENHRKMWHMEAYQNTNSRHSSDDNRQCNKEEAT